MSSGAVLHYCGARRRAWATALTWLDHPVDADGDTAWTTVSGAVQLVRLRERLVRTVRDEQVSAASGAPVPPERLHESYDDARRLLAIAQARAVHVLAYEDAGVLQVLLTTPRERLQQYVATSLGPVLERPELMQTLRAWLAGNGSRQTVSEQLHLHRNSVGYRVRRIKELLGGDPLAPQTAAQLHLALGAWDLLVTDGAVEDASRTADSGLRATV